VELKVRSLSVVALPIPAQTVACKEMSDQEGFPWPNLVNFQMQAVRLEAISSAVVLHQHSGGGQHPR
jgi:hypothetical protein